MLKNVLVQTGALVALLQLVPGAPLAQQATAPAAQAAAPAAQREVRDLTDEQIEHFLKTAKVVKRKDAGKGVTNSIRATMSDGTITHDAHIQTIEQSQREFVSARGTEYNFRDSWQFNIAAYKIDRLLGLHIVPVSVERRHVRDAAAYTWWVDDVLMEEGERLKTKQSPPDARCWNDQVRLMRLLDQLIENTDRNLGNILITKSWRLWAIDHTRAFRRSDKPKLLDNITRVDREVLRRLEALDEPTLKKEVGRHIGTFEIKSMLRRRDAILEHFKKLGDAAVYDRSPVEEGCLKKSLIPIPEA